MKLVQTSGFGHTYIKDLKFPFFKEIFTFYTVNDLDIYVHLYFSNTWQGF
jgi:hypothetical protein